MTIIINKRELQKLQAYLDKHPELEGIHVQFPDVDIEEECEDCNSSNCSCDKKLQDEGAELLRLFGDDD